MKLNYVLRKKIVLKQIQSINHIKYFILIRGDFKIPVECYEGVDTSKKLSIELQKYADKNFELPDFKCDTKGGNVGVIKEKLEKLIYTVDLGGKVIGPTGKGAKLVALKFTSTPSTIS